MTNDTFLNLTEYCFKQNVATQPNKTAMIEVNQIGHQKEWSYQELYTEISKVAEGLNQLHLKPGSAFVIRAEKDATFIILFFAAIAASLVPISSLASLKEDELEFILNESKAPLFYEAKELATKVNLPDNCKKLTDGDIKQFSQQDLKEPIRFKTHTDDPAYIIFTSGSSGTPKGVVHAQHSIIGREPIRKYLLGINDKDITLITGKPCWTYSMGTGFFDTFAAGTTSLLYSGKTTASIWLELVSHYKVTILISSPFYYRQMESLKNIKQYDLSSLKCAITAGEKMEPSLRSWWTKNFDAPLYEALGMSEISTFIGFGKDIPYREGSIGKIQPGRKIAILKIDDGENETDVDEPGLLAINKNNLGFMLHYLNAEDNKAAPFRGDWFVTGDLVHKDKDGYIYHHGRYDDVLVIAGGERVSPVEVENTLLHHPAVIDVGVSTQKHNDKNLLTGYVVLKDHQKLTDALKKDILEKASEHIADYKIPEILVAVDSIPRNTNGKIIRSALKSLD